MSSNASHFSKFTNICIGLLAFFALLHYGKSLLVPLCFAFLLSFALFPIVKRLEERKVSRLVAILITMFGVILAFSLLVFLIGAQINSFAGELPNLVPAFNNMLADLQTYIERQAKHFNVNIESLDLLNLVIDSATQFFSTGTSIVLTTITTTSSILFLAAIVPIYSFFMLFYRELFYNFILEITPDHKDEQSSIIMGKVKGVVQQYIGGLLMVIFIIAILKSIGLSILGIDNPIFFGTFTALLTVIPYFGILMGSVITALYALLTTGSIWYPLGVIAIYSGVQFLEGNFITPYVMGNRVQLNPLAVIISLLIGGFMWGGAGMILSVPAIAITKMIFDNTSHLKPYGRLLGTNTKPLPESGENGHNRDAGTDLPATEEVTDPIGNSGT